jgi:hypothetical protein
MNTNDAFWARDLSTAYVAAERCVLSPTGRVLLQDVSLDEAVAALPGVTLRVFGTGHLA